LETLAYNHTDASVVRKAETRGAGLQNSSEAAFVVKAESKVTADAKRALRAVNTRTVNCCGSLMGFLQTKSNPEQNLFGHHCGNMSRSDLVSNP
jgi:hypothetical protein